MLLIIQLVILSTNCVYYEQSGASTRHPPVYEKNIVLIHHDESIFHVQEAGIEDGHLTGYILGYFPTSRKTRDQELHIYIPHSLELVMDENRRISIPLDKIAKVEVYNVNLKKTIIATSVLTSVHHNGHYFIKMANELWEIQHTNLVELLAIDHPFGTRVIIDKLGQAHTLSDIQSPLKAFDKDGDSVLEQISSSDGVFPTPQLHPLDHALSESYYLSFTRPAKAKTAKLVVHAKTSLWLDYVYNQFANLFGSKYVNWQYHQNTKPKEPMIQWKLSQGIVLSIYLKQDDEWIFVDYLHEPGAMATRDIILPLDISDVDSEEIHIKLEAGFLFWEIDSVGMDFTEDMSTDKYICYLVSAETQDDMNVASLLRENDLQYYDILHTKGYYEVVRDPVGMPDVAYLESFRNPTIFNKFALELLRDFYPPIGGKK
jgi:hypothetical protein